MSCGSVLVLVLDLAYGLALKIGTGTIMIKTKLVSALLSVIGPLVICHPMPLFRHRPLLLHAALLNWASCLT